MSNTDHVEIPDDTSYAGSERGRKYSSTSKFAILVLGAFGIIGGSIFWSATQEIGESDIANMPRVDPTPGGEIQAGSERYQELLTQFNEQRAERASELGVTFMPTPDVVLQPVDEDDLFTRPGFEDEEPAPEPEMDLITVDNRVEWNGRERSEFGEPPSSDMLHDAVAEQGTPRRGETQVPGGASLQTVSDDDEEENPYTGNMLSQMGNVPSDGRESRVEGQATSPDVLRERERERTMQAGGLDDPSAPASTDADTEDLDAMDADGEVETHVVADVGDLLYGETLNYLTSDLDTPVLAEITTGDLAGARLRGSFQVDDASRRLLIMFSQITIDEETYPVEAYAVDGFTAEATLASDVDRRYLRRYGPILASGFVAGFADSASQVDEEVVISDGTATVVRGAPTTRQSLFSGLSQAGSVIAEDIRERAPSGPEIMVTEGYPIGILVASQVEIEDNDE